MIPIIVNGSPTAKSLSITLKIYPLVFADGTKGLLYTPAENKVTTDILTRKLPSGLINERFRLLIPPWTVSLGFLPFEKEFLVLFNSFLFTGFHVIMSLKFLSFWLPTRTLLSASPQASWLQCA